MSDADERAGRGAALMDERCPGWLDGIDLTRLDIASSRWCIAGQQEGGYPGVMRDLGLIRSADSAARGFEAYPPDPRLSVREASMAIDAEHKALTGAWRNLILARRAEMATVAA